MSTGKEFKNPDFPKPSAFADDPRVQYIEETGKYVFTNPDDGVDFEYDENMSAWFPMVCTIWC